MLVFIGVHLHGLSLAKNILVQILNSSVHIKVKAISCVPNIMSQPHQHVSDELYEFTLKESFCAISVVYKRNTKSVDFWAANPCTSGHLGFRGQDASHFREFTKPRRRRRGHCRSKNKLIHFSSESRVTLKSFSSFLTVKTISKLNMERSVKFGM